MLSPNRRQRFPYLDLNLLCVLGAASGSGNDQSAENGVLARLQQVRRAGRPHVHEG